MSSLTKYVQTNTMFLAGAGVIIGSTTATLETFTDIYGNVLTMASFGNTGYITFEPDTTNEEAATFTGVTPNANGTYTLTGVSSVIAQSPYTQTSGLVRSHAGSTKVVVTDNVAFWNTFTNKVNDETVTGQWTFTNTPIVPGTVSDASTTVKGVSKTSVAPATANNPIVVGTNDTRVPVGYAVDAAGTDSYVITPSPAITAYTAGQIITFQAGTANTGAATININGLGAKTIKKNVSSDLVTGDILLNQIINLVYDGTNMQLVSNNPQILPVYNSGISSRALNAGSGTQTIAHGLGVIPRNVKLTASYVGGTTSIIMQSIGSSNGTTNTRVSTGINSTWFSYTSTSDAIGLSSSGDQNPISNGSTGIVTFDATNITITWTQHSSLSLTVSFMWEANS